MKLLTITLTEDEYRLLQKYTNTLHSNSDEYAAKFLLLKSLNAFIESERSRNMKAAVTRRNNRKAAEKVAVQLYFKNKHKK